MFNISLNRFIPAPSYFVTSVGSLGLAAMAGGAYGLAGRFLYPTAGIHPLHYAIWFVAAYQIKQVVFDIEAKIENFIGSQAHLEYVKQLSEDERTVADRVRLHSWEAIILKDRFLAKIDYYFSYCLNVRPCQEVTAENVQDASFLEMCRFRTWNVFKRTVIDNISVSLAQVLTHRMGFSLPAHTSVPLFLAIEAIFQNILLVPIVYKYLHFCNELATHLDQESATTAIERAEWLKRLLPSL